MRACPFPVSPLCSGELCSLYQVECQLIPLSLSCCSAGSRNEAYDTLGASHLLRLAGNLSTQRSSAFAIQRNIQQVGGTLTAWGDREFVGYTVTTTAADVETGLCYLQDLVQPAFKPWELSDNANTIYNQLDFVSKEVRVLLSCDP